MAKNGNLILNPNPIYVSIGTPATTNCFWASELISGAKNQISSDFLRVLKLEKRLAQKYNTKEVKLNPEGQINDEALVEGSIVAFRLNAKSRLWYRGRIQVLFFNSDSTNCANIFMLDYGKMVYHVKVRTNVRLLPFVMRKLPKFRAFQVIIGGVRPVSLEAKYALDNYNLTEYSGSAWNEKSMKLIQGIFMKSVNKVAKITDWAKDCKGRIHGQVEVVINNQGFKKGVWLKDALLANNCASYSIANMKNDLAGKKTRVSYSMNTSICGNSTEGFRSFKNFDDFTKYCEESELNKTSDTTMTQAPKKSRPIGPNPRITVKERKRPRPSADSSIIISNSDPNVSIWEELRQNLSLSTTSYDTHSTNVMKSVVVPAGVDLGKFLERQLKRLKSPPIGPKMIRNLPEFQEKDETDENVELEKKEFPKELFDDEGW